MCANKYGLPILLLFFFSLFDVRAQDTIHVVSHDGTLVVTDPSKGFNTYTHWAVFPAKNYPIRKITLHIQFSCPDSMRCADWDYLDHVRILRVGGQKGRMQDFEIGRMLTPYGGAFSSQWSFDWQADVTDFSMLLRDSVEVEYKHTGYEPNNDRGWKVTVSFEIIRGQPALEPVSIQKIYEGSYAYGDSSKPINDALNPVDFVVSKGATIGRLWILQTGHGMDMPDGCGEFCNKYRAFWYDGKQMDKKAIWKKCGANPLYPQAGTWIYDRANWCPGYLLSPEVYEVDLENNKQHTIRLQMENYRSPQPSANELISAYLIQYRPYKHREDIALLDVMIPSSKKIYSRMNPAGFNPRIIVRNNGSANIHTLQFQFKTENFPYQQYQWTGNLSSGMTDTILLPGLISYLKGHNTFFIKALRPNGKHDAYDKDNYLHSDFTSPAMHGKTLIFFLQTNKQANQNAYKLIDAQGKVLYQRPLASLQPFTTYRDTFHLDPGNYQFQMIDTAGNGLEFWYDVDAGRGRALLLDSSGKIIKNFLSDFGSEITYNFSVSDHPDSLGTNQTAMGLFPTRTKDKTIFDFLADTAQEIKVQLVADPGGQIVEEHRYENLKEATLTYDLNHYGKGRFYFKVFIHGELVFNKRIRLVE